MKSLVLRGGAAALLVIALLGCISTPIQRSAPLAARNQHPAQLTAIHAPAREARPVPVGNVDATVALDYTSLWLRPGRGRDELNTDGELFRTELGARVGILPGFDLEIGIPILHPTSGFLDAFIEGWHDAFGLPQNSRDDFPRHEFDVGATRVRRDGAVVDAYRLEEDGLHVGDIPVFLSWFPFVAEGEGFSFGVRGGVEFPTGDDDDGFGTGGLDWNLGALGQWAGPGYTVFAWGGRSWLHRPDRAERANLDYPAVDSFAGGVELGITEKLSALGQVEWERSVLRRLDDDNADQDQVLIWFGGRYRFSDRMDLELGLSEDLVSDVSADVTFHAGFRVRF